MTVCRLCLQKADKHYTLLCSGKSLGKNLPERISQLLDISMSNELGYPDRVCRGFSDKSISVEKHLAQLKERNLSRYKTFNRKRAAKSLTNPGRCLFTEQNMWSFFTQNTIMKQYLYVVFSDDLRVVPIDEEVPILLMH